jgi:hypothetical protein
MIDEKTARKIRDEMSSPIEALDLLVDTEIRRIRSAVISSNDEDREDLITYAKSVIGLRAEHGVALNAPTPEIAALQEENARLEDELADALQAPWPEWASSILKTLQANGYDPIEDDGSVDLAQAFGEYLEGIRQADEAYSREIAALRAENERLREALKPFSNAARNFAVAIGSDGVDDAVAVVATLHGRPEREAVLTTLDFSNAEAAFSKAEDPCFSIRAGFQADKDRNDKNRRAALFSKSGERP